MIGLEIYEGPDSHHTFKHQQKKRIGPKSVMQRWQHQKLPARRKLSREVICQLEKYFVANVTKPQDQQMEKWAEELNVDFQNVVTYFHNKWRGKLHYEAAIKSKQNVDIHYIGARKLKRFDPDIVEDNSFYSQEEEHEDEAGVIQQENAEEDCFE